MTLVGLTKRSGDFLADDDDGQQTNRLLYGNSCRYCIVTLPLAHAARGKVIGRVVVVVIVMDTKITYFDTYAPEQLIGTTNQSNLAKKWLQYASN